MDSSPPGQPPAVPPSTSADANRAPDGRPLARAGDRLAAHVIDVFLSAFAASTPFGVLVAGEDTVAYASLTRGMLAKRWVSALGCAIFASCGGILDPLWLLWDRPYRQCLHDKWPRTIVVQL